MNQTTDKPHLRFGGSTAHRWMHCPGSAKLCATLPPQPENERMAAGTRAHALLELALGERAASVDDYAGVSLRPGWPAFKPDDIEAVQTALDYVNGILERHPDALFWTERMYSLAEDVGGSADVVIYIPSSRHLIIIDYKHGRGKFVPADAPQIKFYGTCAVFNTPEYPADRIDTTIIQPRCPVGDPIRTAVYSPGDLIAFSDDVDAAVALANSDDPPLNPGEVQCDWCPAAHVCPALFNKVPEATNNAVALTHPEPDTDTILSLPSPERMRANVPALAETLFVIPLIQAWIDAVEDHASALALQGQHIPGFKLVAKQARRKFADEAAALAWFASETMADEDDYAPRKLLSVAQAEKLAKTVAGKDGVKALAGLVVKESSGLKLVPDDAKGDAVNPVAVAEAGFASAVPLIESKG